MGRSSDDHTFAGDFKKFFGRGLGVLLPSILTLWILVQLGVFLFNNVGAPINRAIRLAIIEVMPRVVEEDELPEWFSVSREEIQVARNKGTLVGIDKMNDEQVRKMLRREKFKQTWERHWYLEATGIVVAIVIIYFAGMFLGGYIGRRVYSQLESFLGKVPGFKQVYPHVKQVVEMVIGDRPIAFNRVVLVEYPRKGVWTVGLVTGSSMRSIHNQAGDMCLSIFVPSTPTPFTGFTINVPIKDIIDLPVSVEEAVRFFITGGVLVPDREAVDKDLTPEQRLALGEMPSDAGPKGEDQQPDGSESDGPKA